MAPPVSAPGAAVQTRDPVCGMIVDPTSAIHHADYAGETQYFCSGGCKAKFVANPNKYLPIIVAAAMSLSSDSVIGMRFDFA